MSIFDHGWHNDLLKENGISGKLLNTVTNFLYQRKSCSKLEMLFMGCNCSRDSKRFYTWTIVSSNVHKQLIWWFSIQCIIVSRKYISIPYSGKYDLIRQWHKQLLIRSNYLSIPMENELSRYKSSFLAKNFKIPTTQLWF